MIVSLMNFTLSVWRKSRRHSLRQSLWIWGVWWNQTPQKRLSQGFKPSEASVPWPDVRVPKCGWSEPAGWLAYHYSWCREGLNKTYKARFLIEPLSLFLFLYNYYNRKHPRNHWIWSRLILKCPRKELLWKSAKKIWKLCSKLSRGNWMPYSRTKGWKLPS